VYETTNAEKIKGETMELSSELMKSCQLVSSWYKVALKEKNSLTGNNEASRKRKIASDDIVELRRQKLNEEECILNLNKEIEQKSLEAEEKQDLTLLAMANSFEATQKTKVEKLKVLSDTIQKMEDELKNEITQINNNDSHVQINKQMSNIFICMISIKFWHNSFNFF
jgi:hypothetical protein